jgi:tRNA pseudouridine55 synthase
MTFARKHPMTTEPEVGVDPGELLLVRKPKGWTSFDVVKKIRSILHAEKVGHAGTLDPMATGLMIVCSGKRTKELGTFAGLEKEYEARMLLGARTASFDAETPVIERHSTDDLTEESVQRVLKEFAGAQVQLPPLWSAAKVGGRRLYKYARKGEQVERKPREVYVTSIHPTFIRIPEVGLRIVCSKGTYVRTLVDDIGKRLGCGAYLIALERTRIGNFLLSDARSIDDLVRGHSRQNALSV